MKTFWFMLAAFLIFLLAAQHRSYRVRVRECGSRALSTVWADPELAVPAANPVWADAQGRARFYTDATCHEIQVSDE